MFIPSLVKHRRLLGEVLLISLFVQLFARVSPLFFQLENIRSFQTGGALTLLMDVLFSVLFVAVMLESEAILHQNMAAICKGRTVIIIAHRLTAVRHAHRIIAMDRARIVEAGSHDMLLQQGGLYARLWRMQTAAVGTPERAA